MDYIIDIDVKIKVRWLKPYKTYGREQSRKLLQQRLDEKADKLKIRIEKEIEGRVKRNSLSD